MATDNDLSVNTVSLRRLWFGLTTSVVAWLSLGCLDILINWLACMRQEDYGIPNPHPAARFLIGLVALLLLLVALSSGFISYRNWRHLSAQPLLSGEAVEHHQFIALLGVIVTVTLGAGILWLAIPPFFLDICWRAR